MKLQPKPDLEPIVHHARKGSVRGTETLNEDYGSRVPLLSSFEFAYEKLGDPGAEVDNHIRGIVVQPEFDANTLTVGMYDKSPESASDRLKYRVNSYSVPKLGIEVGRWVSEPGVIVKERARLDFPPRIGETFVLIGFRLESVHDRDFTMKRIGAGRIQSEPFPSGQGLNPTFAVFDPHVSSTFPWLPDGDSWNFRWDIQYAWVPDAHFVPTGQFGASHVQSNGTGTAQFPLAVANEPQPPPTVPVICGFELSFGSNTVGTSNASHHNVRRVSVGVIPGTATVEMAFHDKNADDAFSYEVTYRLLKA